jgi:hypothetical protein
MRQSLRLRDWQRVQDLVRQWEADGKLSEKPAPLTVKEACDNLLPMLSAEFATAYSLQISTPIPSVAGLPRQIGSPLSWT